MSYSLMKCSGVLVSCTNRKRHDSPVHESLGKAVHAINSACRAAAVTREQTVFTATANEAQECGQLCAKLMRSINTC